MTPQQFSELPCYDNAQRLARLETMMETIDKKLDGIVDHPCARCQNTETVTRLRTKMQFVQWVGGTLCVGFLAAVIERIMK